MKKVICQSGGDGVTRAYARKLIDHLTIGGLLLLTGELGAGKTTFVQGLAEALHVNRNITSPTFTLLNSYLTTHPVIEQLVHVDLYRLEDNASLTELDLPQWLDHPRALVVVEWPERSAAAWPTPLGTIHFELGDTLNQRRLEIAGQIAAVFGATE